MADTQYRYDGPLSGVTLREKGEGGTITERTVALNPGAEVKLPADHPYVKKLVGRRLLTELAPASAPSTDSAASDSSEKSDRSDKKKSNLQEATNAG